MVYLNNGMPIKYSYKFSFKETCDKIGKDISKTKKTWSYKCVKRFVK
jgi:hypothetical protein